jgi:hypothetical protein
MIEDNAYHNTRRCVEADQKRVACLQPSTSLPACGAPHDSKQRDTAPAHFLLTQKRFVYLLTARHFGGYDALLSFQQLFPNREEICVIQLLVE